MLANTVITTDIVEVATLMVLSILLGLLVGVGISVKR